MSGDSNNSTVPLELQIAKIYGALPLHPLPYDKINKHPYHSKCTQYFLAAKIVMIW